MEISLETLMTNSLMGDKKCFLWLYKCYILLC